MTLPALALTLAPADGGLAIARRAGLGPSAEGLLLGRPLTEARRLLPLIFGLCRAAQETALALALDETPPAPDALRRDMIRDHLAKLCLHLPRALGQPPLPLPAERDGAPLRAAIFGPEGLPAPEHFDRWRASAAGAAPVVEAVARAFAPGEAVADLPPFDPENPFGDALISIATGLTKNGISVEINEMTPLSRVKAAASLPPENTLALRWRAHPLLTAVRARWGHGPLAHLTARLIDLDALSRGDLPAPRRLAPGLALTPCSRGTCALRLRTAAGLVTAIARHTPTEALLAPGGLLEASLRRLPPAKAALAPLLVEILDPCLPIRIEGGVHA